MVLDGGQAGEYAPGCSFTRGGSMWNTWGWCAYYPKKQNCQVGRVLGARACMGGIGCPLPPLGKPFMWSVRFCLSQPSLPHLRHLGLLRASALPDPMPPCICSPFGISTLRGWVPAVNHPVVPGDTPLTVASADLTSILLAGMKALGGRGAAWFVVRGASYVW